MQRICRKCGHVKKNASGDNLEPCPACGAIYSRVQAAQAAAATVVTPAPMSMPRPRVQTGNYLSTLREQSNYPTFRGVILMFTIVGYILTGLAALGTLMLFTNIRDLSVRAFIVGLTLTVVLFVMTRVFKEVSLMLVDGCDALVRMAELRDPR